MFRNTVSIIIFLIYVLFAQELLAQISDKNENKELKESNSSKLCLYDGKLYSVGAEIESPKFSERRSTNRGTVVIAAHKILVCSLEKDIKKLQIPEWVTQYRVCSNPVTQTIIPC